MVVLGREERQRGERATKGQRREREIKGFGKGLRQKFTLEVNHDVIFCLKLENLK